MNLIFSLPFPTQLRQASPSDGEWGVTDFLNEVWSFDYLVGLLNDQIETKFVM